MTDQDPSSTPDPDVELTEEQTLTEAMIVWDRLGLGGDDADR